MTRRILATLGALGRLPRNRVFLLAMFGRSGWLVRVAFLTLLLAEVATILRFGHAEAASGDFIEYFLVSVGWHSLATPFLLLGGMWAFLRLFSDAQREDLWLTMLRPGEIVLGVMAPPTLAAALVIFGVPSVLAMYGAYFHVERIMHGVWGVLFHNRPYSDIIGLFASDGWGGDVAVLAVITLYLVVMLSLWRVLQEGLIRKGTLRIIVAVRGLFVAVLVGVIALQAELYALAFAHSGALFRSIGILELVLTFLVCAVLLIPAAAGIVASLCQYPGRRWFAGVVTSIEDDEDWLASEASSLAMNDSKWFRFTSPIGRSQLAFLPGVVFGGLVSVVASVALYSFVDFRANALVDRAYFDDDLYTIPTMALAATLAGLLGLHRGKFLSGRRSFLIQPGRVAASIRVTALVSASFSHVPALIACSILMGFDADEWDEIIPMLFMVLVTIPMTWSLHCFLLSAWRLPRLRRVTTVVIVPTILGLMAAVWYPGLDWSMLLALVCMLIPTGAVMFWICGGSYWFFQKLFDQERLHMAGSADDQ